MKRWLTKRNIGLLLIVIATAVIFAVRPGGESEKIKTAKVERRDLVETLTIPGKVQAEKRATLTFFSVGKLGFVRVTFGQKVKTGEHLAGLDAVDLSAIEKAAYYNYLAADANAKEVEDRVKGHDKDETFAQKNDRVTAQTARDKAYDAWLVAQRSVQNSILKSPFAGVVTDTTLFSPGDIVGVTDGITVVDPETMSFETEVNENDIAKISEGLEVVIRLDAYANEEFIGNVNRIGFATRIGDTGATVLPIWVSLPMENWEKLKVGLNGEAELKLSAVKNTLVLPAEAVRNKKVTLLDGKEVVVETGMETDFEVEIKSGLKEGDTVVIQ